MHACADLTLFKCSSRSRGNLWKIYYNILHTIGKQMFNIYMRWIVNGIFIQRTLQFTCHCLRSNIIWSKVILIRIYGVRVKVVSNTTFLEGNNNVGCLRWYLTWHDLKVAFEENGE